MNSNERRLICEFESLLENGIVPSVAKQHLNIYQSRAKNKLSPDFYLKIDEISEEHRRQKHLTVFTSHAENRYN